MRLLRVSGNAVANGDEGGRQRCAWVECDIWGETPGNRGEEHRVLVAAFMSLFFFFV